MARPCDNHGRPYARLSTLKAGDKVQVDDGFTCIVKWGHRLVRQDSTRPGIDGLFIDCRSGRHYLDGQLDDDSDFLIGVYMDQEVPNGDR